MTPPRSPHLRSPSLPPEGAVSPLGRPCGTDIRRHRHCNGFSLIEVLAAFVILALVATALFRLFSGSLTNASAAEEWSRALLIAESQLDAAASAQPLKETTDRGSDSTGAIQWETRVEPYVPPDPNPDLERQAEMLGTRLFRVTTDVKFPAAIKGERTLSLSTVKLAQRNLQ